VSATAPAKLVAAWPDGMDWPTVAPMRGSACGIVSKGRGRPVAALSPSAIRSADQTHAAVKAVAKMAFRLARRATSGAKAIQTSPE
jgi:hypothetical protein